MTKTPFNVVEPNDLSPLCPHCAKELTDIYRKSKGAGLIVGRNSVFFCPHRMKVLGFRQCRMA